MCTSPASVRLLRHADPMTAFRIFLLIVLAAIVSYTVVVVANHGMGLFPIYFGDIAAMMWPGQFNVDFMGFLMLSGLWMAWRHDFSTTGLTLGVCALFGGMPLLSTYLLVASFQVKGDVTALLLGARRASQK